MGEGRGEGLIVFLLHTSIFALWFALAAAIVHADTVTLFPVADTTLIETAPENNLGGQAFFNAGSTALTPPTRNRGLIRFDSSSAVPPQSKIESAVLTLFVVRAPPAENPSTFRLFRMLRSWGEGNKSAVLSPGLGHPADPQEATWLAPFAQTTNRWAAPGGLAGLDFAAAKSADCYVYGIGDSPYNFISQGLGADVQLWLDHPEQNFGWILLTENESEASTARRFGAREDPNNTPILTIEFTPPLRLPMPLLLPDKIRFDIETKPAESYSLEYKNNLRDSSWQTLTNIPSTDRTAPIPVFDTSRQSQRFYRLRATPL